MRAVQNGSHQAALIFLVQRGDCSAFAPCYEKDKRYDNLLMQAQEAGVRIIPIQCELQQQQQQKDDCQEVETFVPKVTEHDTGYQDEYSGVWKPTTPLPCILDFKRPSN